MSVGIHNGKCHLCQAVGPQNDMQVLHRLEETDQPQTYRFSICMECMPDVVDDPVKATHTLLYGNETRQ